MNPLPDLDVSALVPEAAAWRLISLLLECPADPWAGEVAGLAKEVEDSLLQQAAATALKTATVAQYHTIFGPGGPAPPREVSYRETIQPGPFLADLRAMYAAFAYTPLIDETPDHVAVETGFVSYLCLKAAYAQSLGDSDRAAATMDAARHFIAEHISVMTRPFATCLEQSGVAYLRDAAAALLSRAGSQPQTKPFTLPIADTDDCDTAGDFVGA